MYIWLYWENMPNKTMPPYIELCHETIRRNCGRDFDVILTTPANIRQYIPEAGPFEEIKNPNPALRADYIRVQLLHKFGGIWMDSDFIALKSFEPMKELIEKHGFVGFLKNSAGDNHVPVWIMMSMPGGKIITAYKNHHDRILAAGRRRFGWSELGAKSITGIIRGGKFKEEEDFILLPEKLVSPIPWQHKRIQMAPKFHPEQFITDETMGFMLWNNQYPEAFKRLSRDRVLQSNNLVGKVLKIALGM